MDLKKIDLCPLCGESLKMDSTFTEHMNPDKFYVSLFCDHCDEAWEARLSISDFILCDAD